MAGPTNPAHLDHAVQLYLSGKSAKQIQTDTGISRSVLYRALRANGIPPRGSAIALPLQDITAAYEAGESEQSIANRYGVMRAVVRRHLKQAGVQLRGSAEANALRMSKLTSDDKARLTEAAHAAMRGKVPTMEDLQIRAQAREANPWHADRSEGEILFRELLEQRGVSFVPQKAIGPYNVDFAVATVAVEILGGGWHSDKARHALRSPYILDAGWHLLMIWNYEGRSALRPEAADYLVAFLDEVGRDPAASRQYRVIGGGGELLTARRREDDEFPLVPPPRGRKRSRA